MNVDIIELKEGYTPEYQHETDACCDCKANLNSDVEVAAWCMTTVPLGFKVGIPVGYKGSIKPRSGLARNHGIIAVPGTIDPGYIGEVCATVINFSDMPFVIHDGDRICQFEITESKKIFFNSVKRLPESERSTKGFGSTGV